MDSQIKVCPHCQTINEPDYVYCKRCGTALPAAAANAQGPAQPNAAPGYGPQGAYGAYNAQPGYPPQAGYSTPGGYGYGPATIGGVPTDQFETFVGNAPTLKQKIRKMELTGAKTSWNWPVFLTSFFGGALLTPCWFFHRKMNKIAAVLLAVGVVFTLLSVLIVAPVLEATTDMMQDIVELNEVLDNPYSSWAIDYEEEVEQIALEYMQKISGVLAWSSLVGLLQLAYTIVISLFANHLYKQHAAKTILATTSSGTVTWEQLSAKGGTCVIGWIILGTAALILSVGAGIWGANYIFSEMFSYLSYLQ